MWPSDTHTDGYLVSSSGLNQDEMKLLSVHGRPRSLSAPLFTTTWLQGLPASSKPTEQYCLGNNPFPKLNNSSSQLGDPGRWMMAVLTFEKWGDLAFARVLDFFLFLWLTSNWQWKHVWPSWAKSSVSGKSHMWKDVSTSGDPCSTYFLNLLPPGPPGNISRGGSNLEPESGWAFFVIFFKRKIKDYNISLSLKIKVNPIAMSSIQEKMKRTDLSFCPKFPGVLVFFPALEVFIFTFSVQLRWNIYSPGMNSRHFHLFVFPKLFKIVEWYVPAKGWSSVVIGEFSEMCSHVE